MSAIAATTTPVEVTGVGSRSFVVQNLGPDTLYLGNDNTVTAANGVRLLAGGDFVCRGQEVPVWMVSAGSSDVRTMLVSQ